MKILMLARISPINVYLNLWQSKFSLKKSKSLQNSKENLFELCLNRYISMKLLSTQTSDNVPVSSKKFKNCRVQILSETPETATGDVLYEKVFLEILQNSQENTCARASFVKKRLQHRCFLVNLAKFLRTPFLQNTP